MKMKVRVTSLAYLVHSAFDGEGAWVAYILKGAPYILMELLNHSVTFNESNIAAFER